MAIESTKQKHKRWRKEFNKACIHRDDAAPTIAPLVPKRSNTYELPSWRI